MAPGQRASAVTSGASSLIRLLERSSPRPSIPTLTHEDPRYYTLGKGGLFKRSNYAVMRTFITKNDRGTNEFNISEIAGNATEAGLSNLYYPSSERVFAKSAQNFATQTAITAGANVLKEFWPDIRKNVLRMKN